MGDGGRRRGAARRRRSGSRLANKMKATKFHLPSMESMIKTFSYFRFSLLVVFNGEARERERKKGKEDDEKKWYSITPVIVNGVCSMLI